MKTLRTLQPRHVSGILDLWSRRWGSRFPLDLALWRQNTEGDKAHFRPERCWVIEGDEGIAGSLALKVPGDPPAWPGQDPSRAWISFLLVEPGREADLAVALVEQALSWLRSSGFSNVVYGSDPSHFFPGVPEEDSTLRSALEVAGFQAGEIVYDLVRDLQGYRAPDSIDALLLKAEATIRACAHRDVPALLTFLNRSFPGRWAYDTRRRLDVEDTPADILILKWGADVIGFCHVYHRGSRCIGPSIYWHRAIGDRYGGLGPIGLDPALRGRGLGLALLALAVERLRRLGVERAVIDWTTLTGFYERLGFHVWRTYRLLRLDL